MGGWLAVCVRACRPGVRNKSRFTRDFNDITVNRIDTSCKILPSGAGIALILKTARKIAPGAPNFSLARDSIRAPPYVVSSVHGNSL